MSESLAQSFTKMVTLIESETKFLKGMASLRGSDTEVHNKLKSMNSFVSRLENNMNDFEAFVDQELQSLAAMEELGLQSEKQLADVLAVKENIPQFLNIDTQHFQQDRVEGGQQQEEEEEEEEGAVKRYGSSTLSARKQTDRQTIPSERPPSAPSQPNISMGSEFVFITSDELEAVPKSTRGRLTLAQVTSALRTLVSLMEDKNKLVTKAGKQHKALSPANRSSYEEYKQLKGPEHEGRIFLTERELRLSPVFGAGQASGRAVLHTLRALRRLRQVHTHGQATYVLLRPQ